MITECLNEKCNNKVKIDKKDQVAFCSMHCKDAAKKKNGKFKSNIVKKLLNIKNGI